MTPAEVIPAEVIPAEKTPAEMIPAEAGNAGEAVGSVRGPRGAMLRPTLGLALGLPLGLTARSIGERDNAPRSRARPLLIPFARGELRRRGAGEGSTPGAPDRDSSVAAPFDRASGDDRVFDHGAPNPAYTVHPGTGAPAPGACALRVRSSMPRMRPLDTSPRMPLLRVLPRTFASRNGAGSAPRHDGLPSDAVVAPIRPVPTGAFR